MTKYIYAIQLIHNNDIVCAFDDLTHATLVASLLQKYADYHRAKNAAPNYSVRQLPVPVYDSTGSFLKSLVASGLEDDSLMPADLELLFQTIECQKTKKILSILLSLSLDERDLIKDILEH